MSEIYKDYLEHSLRGSERKNHKYIDRKWKNGHWVYTYHHDNNDFATRSTNKMRYKEGRNAAKQKYLLNVDGTREEIERAASKARDSRNLMYQERDAHKEYANRKATKMVSSANELVRKAGHTTAGALTKSSKALNKGKDFIKNIPTNIQKAKERKARIEKYNAYEDKKWNTSEQIGNNKKITMRTKKPVGKTLDFYANARGDKLKLSDEAKYNKTHPSNQGVAGMRGKTTLSYRTAPEGKQRKEQEQQLAKLKKQYADGELTYDKYAKEVQKLDYLGRSFNNKPKNNQGYVGKKRR